MKGATRTKTMTVRDIRLHWPQAERLLQQTDEVIVTRDGTPVARLLPFSPRARSRGRFDPEAHMKWLTTFSKGKVRGPSTGEWLARDRED